jgi:hypothetical protein
MFQRAVSTRAINIANKFGDVGPLVAIGIVFVHACAQTATILVRHSTALMGHMAARAIGVRTQTPAGTTFVERRFTLIRSPSHQL